MLAALAELDLPILRVVGEEATSHCFKHEERTGKADRHPSWACNTETGVFNCFSCGYRGSFVKLVSDVLDVDWDDAETWVRQRGGIERVNKILGRGQYLEDLLESQEVREYTEADLALYTLPPLEARRKRGLTKDACEKYGVLWDPERDMWITPIRDFTGKLLGWQEKNERHFKNRPYSVKKSQALFGFHVLPPGGTAIVVESPLDCPRIESVGVSGAVSSYGADISDIQMQMLFEHSELVIIARDNDRAGWKAAEAIKQRYRGMGRRIGFWNYTGSDAKDPGDQSGNEIRFGAGNYLSPLRVRFPK
ncbi:toprim domain-containing protein [Streptomyces sp. NPDC005551]|uniref:toprim domain-containing protein n=1 Tax=Streptomyces sp. NPDC005551 TaxID=3364725 RepID=UPI0036AAE06C